jgi:hypothetical protein
MKNMPEPRTFRIMPCLHQMAACILVLACFAATGMSADLEMGGLDAARLPQGARTDLEALDAAYPGVLAGVRIEQGAIYVLTRSGKRFAYDDGKVKTPQQALEDPDLQDMLAQVYDTGPAPQDIAENWHPGRRRVTAFFEEVYGHDPAEVTANSRRVRFLDATVLFNARNGAADALSRVSDRLSELVSRDPALRQALYPVVGTFSWRIIAGTRRLSMHSLAIAIDVNPGRNPYWRHHRRPSAILSRRKSFPATVVAAFEAEGFIWGGKWAEYDLMHFEYRPELLIKSRMTAHGPSETPMGENALPGGDVAQ